MSVQFDLRSAQSEDALNNHNRQAPRVTFTSQKSQDDSTVCYSGNRNCIAENMTQKSYSYDVPLTNLKSGRYNCDILIEEFLLGRAKSKSCNSANGATTSESLLHLVEVSPLNGSFIQSDSSGWKMSMDPFRIRNFTAYKHLSRNVRNYYKDQNALIRSFEEVEQLFCDDDGEEDHSPVIVPDHWPRRLAIISLFFNVMLLIAKSVAVNLSGSMAIISSLVDSAVDIVASLIIWWTSSAMVKRDPYVYPEGRTRLEPVAVIILSVLMSLAAIQLVVEALERIMYLRRGDVLPPSMQSSVIIICFFVIVTKLALYICSRHVFSRSVSVKALQLDHRNDVFSNSLAILCAFFGSRQAISLMGEENVMYIDPLGAVLMSAYIMMNWWSLGIEQIKLLTGHTATPRFLSKLTWICLNHHQKVKQIDTVRAFHFGNNFLVEVDIVLPGNMSIRESHDIGESLQHKLEKLVEVERAFVHLDYECTHNPNAEHKVV